MTAPDTPMSSSDKCWKLEMEISHDSVTGNNEHLTKIRRGQQKVCGTVDFSFLI
jgi:hypothetical protein